MQSLPVIERAPVRANRVAGGPLRSILLGVSLASVAHAQDECIAVSLDLPKSFNPLLLMSDSDQLYLAGTQDGSLEAPFRLARSAELGWTFLPGRFNGTVRSVSSRSVGIFAVGEFTEVDDLAVSHVAAFEDLPGGATRLGLSPVVIAGN